MESIFTRHRNYIVLGVVLCAQLFGLAYQVKRPAPQGSTRLVRIWAVSAVTPFEKAFVHSGSWISQTWQNYFYLRNVRRQNEQLRDEIQKLRLEQARLTEDANQARRLQTLLAFKEQFISETMAAQVFSTTGSDFSRGVYIDKGSHDGIKAGMPVITPDGIVGKVYRVFPTSSLVLEINDPTSGAGVILQKSRLQGILKGDPARSGETWITNIMSDEKVEAGDLVFTSGGDGVYPKGLPVGQVDRVLPGSDSFLKVEVRPSARLDRVEEVLVITKIVDKLPVAQQADETIRAIDILAQRLPGVPPPSSETKGNTPLSMQELIAREKAAQKAAQQPAAPAQTATPETNPAAGSAQPHTAAPGSAKAPAKVTKPEAAASQPKTSQPKSSQPATQEPPH